MSRCRCTVFTILMLALLTLCTVSVVTAEEWEAFCTVMDRRLSQQGADVLEGEDADRYLNDLVQLGISNNVLQRSAETLFRLGITTSPEVLLRTLSVKRLPETNIIAIYVRSDDQTTAKAACDVVAAELVAAHREAYTIDESEPSALHVVDAASVRPYVVNPMKRFRLDVVVPILFGVCVVGAFALGRRSGIARMKRLVASGQTTRREED